MNKCLHNKETLLGISNTVGGYKELYNISKVSLNNFLIPSILFGQRKKDISLSFYWPSEMNNKLNKIPRMCKKKKNININQFTEELTLLFKFHFFYISFCSSLNMEYISNETTFGPEHSFILNMSKVFTFQTEWISYRHLIIRNARWVSINLLIWNIFSKLYKE